MEAHEGIEHCDWIDIQRRILQRLIDNGVVEEADHRLFYLVGEFFALFFECNFRVPLYEEVISFIFEVER